jgi:hypothetical protein
MRESESSSRTPDRILNVPSQERSGEGDSLMDSQKKSLVSGEQSLRIEILYFIVIMPSVIWTISLARLTDRHCWGNAHLEGNRYLASFWKNTFPLSLARSKLVGKRYFGKYLLVIKPKCNRPLPSFSKESLASSLIRGKPVCRRYF